MITYKIITSYVGATSVIDSDLANVVILRVCRQGLGYNQTTSASPGGREYDYVSGSGEIIFSDPFIPVDPFGSVVDGEKIYVRYKIP